VPLLGTGSVNEKRAAKIRAARFLSPRQGAHRRDQRLAGDGQVTAGQAEPYRGDRPEVQSFLCAVDSLIVRAAAVAPARSEPGSAHADPGDEDKGH
jgi:hypothetical protein